MGPGRRRRRFAAGRSAGRRERGGGAVHPPREGAEVELAGGPGRATMWPCIIAVHNRERTQGEAKACVVFESGAVKRDRGSKMTNGGSAGCGDWGVSAPATIGRSLRGRSTGACAGRPAAIALRRRGRGGSRRRRRDGRPGCRRRTSRACESRRPTTSSCGCSCRRRRGPVGRRPHCCSQTARGRRDPHGPARSQSRTAGRGHRLETVIVDVFAGGGAGASRRRRGRFTSPCRRSRRPRVTRV